MGRRTHTSSVASSSTRQGEPNELDRAVNGTNITDIVLTHTHPDHVGGVAHYAEVCDATVWARYGHEERFADATGTDPDRTFREGTKVGPLTVIETPGHAPDHLAFATDEGVVSGDLAVAEGSVVVAAGEGRPSCLPHVAPATVRKESGGAVSGPRTGHRGPTSDDSATHRPPTAP